MNCPSHDRSPTPYPRSPRKALAGQVDRFKIGVRSHERFPSIVSLHPHRMAGQGRFFNFLIIFIVALGSFTYGFNNAITGSVFGLPGFFDVRLPGLNRELHAH